MRLEIIQRIVKALDAQVYLEIGVQSGRIISKVKAPVRIGVDPDFKLKPEVWIKQNLWLSRFKAFEMSSDAFFDQKAPQQLSSGVDVAFIDGLHTYAQVVKDVQHTLKYLKPHGVMILHDCNPMNAAGAFPVKDDFSEMQRLISQNELPGWNGHWNGDVWKAIAYFRISKPDLEVFTLDLDWGLGIIRRGQGVPLNAYTVTQIESADYELLEQDRKRILDLRHPKYIDTFINQLTEQF